MDQEETNKTEFYKEFRKTQRRGKIMGGLLLIAIGSLFLAKELGAIFPVWLLSWKTLLIAIGIVIAIKHKFQHASWILLVGIGSIFLLNDFYPDLHIKPIIWPIIIIFIGLFMMFKPRRHHYYGHHAFNKKWKYDQHRHWKSSNPHSWNTDAEDSNDDRISSTTIMGGIKKNIYSKAFKGGEITNVFGGSEINLLQADIENKASLELVQVFGGTKLIIPANWQIKSELVSILGGIEDKRPVEMTVGDNQVRVLNLSGVVVFGGIEITSI